MKYALKGGLQKNLKTLDAKDFIRYQRIMLMDKIKLIEEKPVEWEISQQIGSLYNWTFTTIWEEFEKGTFKENTDRRKLYYNT